MGVIPKPGLSGCNGSAEIGTGGVREEMVR